MNKSFNFTASNRQRGVATLPTIFALIILIVAVSVGVTALSLSDSFISLGSYQSSQALIYAEAGARDALLRIVRNKNYTCATADCYSIDFASDGCSTNEACARISVSAGVGSGADPKIIISKGQMRNKVRRVQVDVVFDASLHGKISSATWKELTD